MTGGATALSGTAAGTTVGKVAESAAAAAAAAELVPAPVTVQQPSSDFRITAILGFFKKNLLFE